MGARFSTCWVASLALTGGLLISSPGLAQPQGSDVFSSSGEYDRFAVGGAHRWYDNHSTEFKQKSSHCLSILDEAKAFQDKALALYEEAKRPGNSRRQTELVRQANEQIRLRGEKLRAFKDCVNQAISQTGPQSDQFASTGTGTAPDDVQTQPTPQPSPGPDNGGSKGIKRIPEKPSTPRTTPQALTLEKAVDDCFANSVPNYRNPNWTRFSPAALRPDQAGQLQQSFDISGFGADQALDLDEAVYGAWKDRELMRDYLVGWLTHCLTDQKVLPKQDPRIPYRRFMEAREPVDSKHPKRITRRFEEFGYGYRSYPLPPFWDHDVAGPPAPAQ
ncbi:MAG: hypothetical protein H8J66_13780 [Nitrospira sp.]|nr:hypothetical protein [Nitrospira sp.]